MTTKAWISELLGNYGFFHPVLLAGDDNERVDTLEDKLMRAHLKNSFAELLVDIKSCQDFIDTIRNVVYLARQDALGAKEFLLEMTRQVKRCTYPEAEHRTKQMLRTSDDQLIHDIFPAALIKAFLDSQDSFYTSTGGTTKQ
jgi:hypothetical protein